MPEPHVLTRLRHERHAVHLAYLSLCKAVAFAAVREPGALPDLQESLLARYTERTALDLQIASYESHGTLFPDFPCTP